MTYRHGDEAGSEEGCEEHLITEEAHVGDGQAQLGEKQPNMIRINQLDVQGI